MTRGALVSVVSGKGGVGKTNLVANVAVAAAGLGARVLVVDGDLGLANIDVLLGLTPLRTVADVLDGNCSFDEALIAGPRGIRVMPAASGRMDLPTYRPASLAGLLIPLFEATERFDLVLVDGGAGVGPAVVTLASACDLALLLVTRDPTSLADAYATLKVLNREAPTLPVEVMVNLARGEIDARAIHESLGRVAKRFLGKSPPYRGYLPLDARLAEAVTRQQAVVEAFPGASSSEEISRLARYLLTRRGPAQRGARPMLPINQPSPTS
ncbi:MAG: MinD/ParA family protein [bacterium]|nr:MinD/ParA family protein [bacterium]